MPVAGVPTLIRTYMLKFMINQSAMIKDLRWYDFHGTPGVEKELLFCVWPAMRGRF
jgi:hypothetical protein